jgi:hypothetical protein
LATRPKQFVSLTPVPVAVARVGYIATHCTTTVVSGDNSAGYLI